MSAEIIVLRLLHVLGGVFWVGTITYLTLYLMPSMVEAGPAAGAVMAGLQKRRILVVLPVVAFITLLSGVRLLQVTSQGFSAQYFATAMGKAILVGAVLSTIGFLIGVSISRPAMARMAVVMAQREQATPDERKIIDAEVSLLRARQKVSSNILTVLVIIATAAMAIARYL